MGEAVFAAIAEGVAAVGTSIAANPVAWIQGASLVYGAYEYSRARRQAGGVGIEWQGQQITIRQTDAIASFLYGKGRPDPVFDYAVIHGDQEQYLTLVYLLGFHEFEAIDDIWLNGESLGVLTAPNVSSGYQFVQPTYDSNGNQTNKWVYTDLKEIAQQVFWPAEGETVTIELPLTGGSSIPSIHHITSIAGTAASGEPVVFFEGSHYTVSGLNTQTVTLTVLPNPYPPVDPTGANVVITYRGGEVVPLVAVRKFLGSPAGERDTFLETASASSSDPWLASDDHRELPAVHIQFQWSQSIFGPIGEPNVAVIARGKNDVLDWRTGVRGYTSNAASCNADYLMHPFGFGAPQSEINTALMQAAENGCDELVPVEGGGFQPRYQIDGLVSTGATRFDNLRVMLGAMAGTACWSGGQWLIRAGTFSSPVYTLEDEDFAPGARTASPVTPMRSSYNSVKGRYADPTYYQPLEFPQYPDPTTGAPTTYIDQDGGEVKVQDIDLPLTSNAVRAQRIAKLLLVRTRNAYTWRAKYNLAAYPLQPGDRVYLKHKRRAWHLQNGGLGKIFMVQARKLNLDGTIDLTFVEDAAAFYSWTYEEGRTPDPAPNTSLPRAGFVPRLENFRAFSSPTTYRVLDDEGRTIIPYVELLWDTSAIANESGAQIWIFWKRATQTTYTQARLHAYETRYEIAPVGPGELISAYAIVVNAANADSEPVFAAHQASPGLPIAGAAAARSSGNLLTNATFRYADEATAVLAHWTYVANGIAQLPPNVHAGKAVASQSPIVGSPSNAVIAVVGAHTAEPYLRSDLIPAKPSTRYAYGALVHGENCDAIVGYQFFNEGQVIIDADFVIDAGRGSGSASVKAGYVPAQDFATSPAGAAFIALVLLKGKSDLPPDKTISAAWFTEPMVAEMADDAIEFPLWDAGQTGTVLTDQLDGNAVIEDEMFVQSPASVNVIGGPNQGVLITSPRSYEALRPRDLVLTGAAAFDLEYAGSNPPTKAVYGIYLQINKNGTGWTVPSVSARALADMRGFALGTKHGAHLSIPKYVVSMAPGDIVLARLFITMDAGVNAVVTDGTLGVRVRKA